MAMSYYESDYLIDVFSFKSYQGHRLFLFHWLTVFVSAELLIPYIQVPQWKLVAPCMGKI